MRPQKLTLRNFMPFRSAAGQVHEVNFANLDLFVITGPMASGKSALIDAIAWCLYGRTARYGSDSKGVISAGENFCEVALDFSIGTQRFRAVRRTGKTTESGLSEWEGEEWVQDTSGSELLTKRIEALLGLDFASFTKTVILPQGSYAEFLLSEPGKRRDLLAKILALGVYSRVAERAKDVAAQAKTRADTIRETLTQYAGVSREQVEQRRAEREVLRNQVEKVSSQEGALRALVQKAEVVATTLTRITALQAAERTRLQEKELAGQEHANAEDRIRALAQALAQTVAERKALGYDANRHEVVKRATAHLRDHQIACQDAEHKGEALALARQELNTLIREIAEQEQRVTISHHVYQDRAAAVQAEVAAGGNIAGLTEKLGEAKRWKELRQEHRQLTQQQQTLAEQLASAQHSLALFVQQETTKDQEFRALTQQQDRQRAEEQEKVRLELEATHLGKDLQEAVREEKRAAQDAEKTRAAFQTAEQEVQKQQERCARAEQQEQAAASALEENRRRHEAAHLRAVLHVGDLCPVCRTPVRALPPPAPQAADDLATLQRAAEGARATLTQARQALQEAHAAAAAARTSKETAEREFAEKEQKRCAAQEQFVLRFPGFPSLAAALSAVQTQRQELATSLKDLEARAQTVEKEQHTLTRQREKAQQEEATLTEALRRVATGLETGTGQLGTLAQALAPYLSANGDPEAVLTARRQALSEAEQEVKTVEQQYRQAADALNALNTHQVQKEGRLGVLASEQAAAVARAEREARVIRESLTLATEDPLPTLPRLESELAELTQKQERDTALLHDEGTLREERENAERLLAGLRADLQACERILRETRQEISQAEQELTAARVELHAQGARSGLSGISADGAGLQEQLAAIHEQVIALREQRSRLEAEITDLERRCAEKEQEEEKLRTADSEGRLATDLHKLLGAEFTDFLSRGAVEALMRDATVHLQRLTHDRYSFDIAYKRRAIELQIVDHEDHRRTRPTHSLSGGETFLASLAIALALSQGFREVAAGKAAKTSTECLILDEGFGTLDREGLQLVTETLQELRGDEGRMVGIITHVEEVAAAMPMRIEVHKGSRTSTITVSG